MITESITVGEVARLTPGKQKSSISELAGSKNKSEDEMISRINGLKADDAESSREMGEILSDMNLTQKSIADIFDIHPSCVSGWITSKARDGVPANRIGRIKRTLREFYKDPEKAKRYERKKTGGYKSPASSPAPSPASSPNSIPKRWSSRFDDLLEKLVRDQVPRSILTSQLEGDYKAVCEILHRKLDSLSQEAKELKTQLDMERRKL